ncbi:hypothetical protein BDY24DRAFT_418504 [Mrakia frigida]|uniref:uncharacterized protein n=1 Tax=Mrakia frigida TaxID=29902 RepID=UPI003FCC15B3
MSRRFTVSPYKNALPSIPDKHLWFHDLPLTSDDPNILRASTDWVIASTGSIGGLVAVHWEDVGKGVDKKGGEWNGLGGKIFALDTCEGEDGETRVVVGGQGGFKIWTLPSPNSASFEPKLLLSISTSTLVQTTSFHPTTPSLLLTTTATTVSIWDTSSSCTDPVIALEPFSPKGLWGVSWSWNGQEIAGAGKDGSFGVWTPRTSTTAQTSPSVFNALKQAAVASVGDLWLVPSFSKSRERQLLLFSSKDLSTPISTIRIDFETAPLFAVVDNERRIVYLAGKGESTIRSFEVSDAGVITPCSAVSLPTAFAAITLAPASVLDVMSAEINRVLVVGRSTEMIPVPIKHYIDFHEDIYPLVRSTEHAQTSSEWLSGGDAQPDLISQDPKSRRPREKKAVVAEASSTSPIPAPPVSASFTSVPAVASAPQATSTPEPLPRSTSLTQAYPSTPTQAPVEPPPISAPPAPSASSKVEPEPVVASNPTPSQTSTAPTSSSTQPTTSSTPSSSKPTVASPPAPRWSRNFLSGSSPLLPAHDNLECLSTSHPADSLLLQATEKFFFFPISGPGGRVGVHPLAEKGRLPLQAAFPNVSQGSELVDFVVVDEGEGTKLITAGEEGAVKIWKIPDGGVEGSLSEPELVIHAKGVDKIAKLVPNPAVKHLLAILSNDFGEGYLRIVNTSTGKIEEAIKIEGGGVYTAAWNASGSHLALACKDRKIRTLDPRQPSSLLVGPAHDSPRSFQLTFIDDQHLASVGFSTGSLRKILLHRLPSDSSSPIEIVGSFALDVSPSVLFPFYDEDTEILLVWGKGEQTVSAFDIQPTNPKTPFHRLPQFAGSMIHGFAFLPKRKVDARKVEVLKALMLTSKTVEEVSFRVPRSKVEFFQDDVFPPTRGPAEVSAEEWLAGKEGIRSRVSLKPDGMKALSEAPRALVVQKRKIEFGKKELTDAEKRAQSMDAMFEKAKLDDDEGEKIKGDEEWSD